MQINHVPCNGCIACGRGPIILHPARRDPRAFARDPAAPPIVFEAGNFIRDA